MDAPIAPMGRLSDLLTREHGRRRPMVVTPYVYRLPHAVALTPGLEAARLWWEPLPNLVDAGMRRTIIWRVAGLPLPFPSIEVSGARLWGLVADDGERTGPRRGSAEALTLRRCLIRIAAFRANRPPLRTDPSNPARARWAGNVGPVR